jgi:hypothetical protein
MVISVLVDCGIAALSVIVIVYDAVLEITVGFPVIAPVEAFSPKLKGRGCNTAYLKAPVPPKPTKGIVGTAAIPTI